jgi:hypothetical protein
LVSTSHHTSVILGIPHQKEKQVFRRVLDIVGLEVNAEAMTITMSDE